MQPAASACILNNGWICADAFVTKLNASGQLVYSTYLGGSSFDGATGIAVDAGGAASVAGVTASFDFPTVNPIQGNNVTFLDAFVAKLNAAGSSLLFSTALGSCLADLGCHATGTATAAIADRTGDLLVAESLYDATNTWGFPQTAAVIGKIDLTGRPILDAGGIVNGASFRPGRVAPGEIVTLFGTGIGPFAGTRLQLEPTGLVATSLGGGRVLFDGVAAPMVYASPNQVNAVVPYAVAGRTSTEVRVEFAGTTSDAITMPVEAAAPGLFTKLPPAAPHSNCQQAGRSGQSGYS